MDAKRGLCIGIDGVTLDNCIVTGNTVGVQMRSLMGNESLTKAWSEAFEVTLKVHGLDAAKLYDLVVSGRKAGSYSGARMANGVGVSVAARQH